MEYRQLGRADLQVSSIGLGCVSFGREIDEKTAFAVMDHALERGINLFDTAEAYAAGRSEEVIGQWIADPAGRYDGKCPQVDDPFHSKEESYRDCDHIAAGTHSSELIANGALHFLTERQSTTPFFMYLSFKSPAGPPYSMNALDHNLLPNSLFLV